MNPNDQGKQSKQDDPNKAKKHPAPDPQPSHNPNDDPAWDNPVVSQQINAQIQQADSFNKRVKSNANPSWSPNFTTSPTSTPVSNTPIFGQPNTTVSNLNSSQPTTVGPPPPLLSTIPTNGPLTTTVSNSASNINSTNLPSASISALSSCTSTSAPQRTPLQIEEDDRKLKRDLAANNAPPLQGMGDQLKISVHQYYIAKKLVEPFPLKTVMCGGGRHTISVTKHANEVEKTQGSPAATSKAYVFHSREEVQNLADNNNHECKPNPTVPTLTPDFHADKQLAVEFDNRNLDIPPSGDSRDMCEDCQAFFARYAVNNNETLIVTDPRATRVFHPDGTITKIVDKLNPEYPEVSPGPNGAWLTDKTQAPTENSKPGNTKIGVYTEYPNGKTKTWLDSTWKKPPDPGSSPGGLSTTKT